MIDCFSKNMILIFMLQVVLQTLLSKNTIETCKLHEKFVQS